MMTRYLEFVTDTCTGEIFSYMVIIMSTIKRNHVA